MVALIHRVREESLMPYGKYSCRALVVITLSLFTAPAPAIPVTDAGAIAHLITQINYWKKQIDGMTEQLAQLKSSYDAMTGTRGMEQLLAGTTRNYLPADWQQIRSAMEGLTGAYGELGRSVQGLIRANAVLTAAQLNERPPEVRALIEDDRRAHALRQATTQEALERVSGRFQAIDQLIRAIATANDPKAIFDLQARIQAEFAMLQNEQTKLQILHQLAQAEDASRRQREWEIGVAGQGRFATRFQPQPR